MNIVRYIITIFAFLVMISGSAFGQDKDILITVKALGPEQYENIQYQSIEENQIVDFDNLLRVYINKSSVVMVDMSPVNFGNTGSTIKKMLIKSVENKYGKLDPESILDAKSDKKLLIRKSIYTNKADLKELMNIINNSIWEMQNYFSNEIYKKNYPALEQIQKDNINKLIPLLNYLGKDNEI